MTELAAVIDGPVAVIGDVHGQLAKLQAVLERVRMFPEFEQRWIVFIGDLVDRGPDPRGAVELVCQLRRSHPRTTLVCGNHELAMAGALGLISTPDHANWNLRWVKDYNSETTFASYGVTPGDLPELAAALPSHHRVLLADLPWCVEHPEYFFVHAGLDPFQPFDLQRMILQTRDYTLNRPQWLCSRSLVSSIPPDDCPKTVVSGHAQVQQVEFRERRILIDTTGGRGGDLSCVLLPENIVITSSG